MLVDFSDAVITFVLAIYPSLICMAILRLFASLGDVAGMRRLSVDASTVGEAVTYAENKFGEEFAEQVQSCRIWLNGEPTGLDVSVGDDDEIALLPPVSGGS